MKSGRKTFEEIHSFWTVPQKQLYVLAKMEKLMCSHIFAIPSVETRSKRLTNIYKSMKHLNWFYVSLSHWTTFESEKCLTKRADTCVGTSPNCTWSNHLLDTETLFLTYCLVAPGGVPHATPPENLCATCHATEKFVCHMPRHATRTVWWRATRCHRGISRGTATPD